MRPLLALALLLAFAAPARAAVSQAFVFQTDYSTGSLSTVDLPARTTHCDVTSVGADAAMRWYGGLLCVVNRAGGDNIQVIDPFTHGTLRQFSVGAGSNPHDIAFASATHAYVTRWESNDLWIVNPVTGAKTGQVSLAAWADADGLCEMDRMIVVGPWLFVSLERIDRNHGYGPADTALVAVVDTRADTLVDCDPARPGVQAIPLQLRNPFTAFQFDRATSRLLIGCVGVFSANDGGIERIDPTALKSDGVAITEAALGGDVNGVAWSDSAHAWAIVATGGDTRLVAWSAATHAVTDTLWAPGGYSLTDVQFDDRGQVWACDGDFAAPKLRVFSAATGQPVGSDIVCTLPPTSVTFDATSAQVSAVPPAALPALACTPPAPNPARAGTRLAFTLPHGAHVRAEVMDAQGRRVRTLADAYWPAGAGALAWDLASERGDRVAPGIYLVRVRAEGAEAVRRVIVLP